MAIIQDKPNKVVQLSQVTVEERVSKKGNKFQAVFAVVNGEKKLLFFVDKQMEFDMYKAGIRL